MSIGVTECPRRVYACIHIFQFSKLLYQSVLGRFPDGHFPDGLFPDGQFPEGQFPRQTIPRRTFHRMIFPRTDISPNYIFLFISSQANEFQQKKIYRIILTIN